MSRYIIHTTRERYWYIDLLELAMIQQGISLEDISVYIDQGDGCLKSYLNSFQLIKECGVTTGNIWHLQDDIIISKRFRELTEKCDDSFEGIVCGMCPTGIEEEHGKYGNVSVDEMWYSFPCIRIPNAIVIEFANWCETTVNPTFRYYIEKNKYVDYLFRCFMINEKRYIPVKNLKPNIVDHVDYLLGGSTINSVRKIPIRAKYFEDKELINGWERKINEYKQYTV